MAKERRSLSAALSLTPEAIAFIGKPDAQVQAKDVLATRPIEVEAVGQGDSKKSPMARGKVFYKGSLPVA